MKASQLGEYVTYYLNQKGDKVSPKKLQKLLYYVEAWYLVYFDDVLLQEDFQAWVHGPVLPSLYHYLKKFGYNNLEVVYEEHDTIDAGIQKIITDNNLTPDKIELIESVLNKYGSMTSFQLEMLSHNEAPWIEAREGCSPLETCTTVIPKSRMQEFYKSTLPA